MTVAGADAQVRLADASDRAAFRSWFVLLADAQFERPAPEVTDCAALVRFAFREALRAHTAGMGAARRAALRAAFPDVRSGAARRTPTAGRSSASPPAPPTRYAEFADARTLVTLNAPPLGRDVAARCSRAICSTSVSPAQSQPDHLMVVRRPIVLRPRA